MDSLFPGKSLPSPNTAIDIFRIEFYPCSPATAFLTGLKKSPRSNEGIEYQRIALSDVQKGINNKLHGFRRRVIS